MRTATGWKLSDIQWAFTLLHPVPDVVQPAQGFLIDQTGSARLHDESRESCAGSAGPGLGVASTSLPMLYTLYVIAGHRRGADLRRLHRLGAEVVHDAQRGLAGRPDRGRISAAGTALFHPVHRVDHQDARLSDGRSSTRGVFQAVVILIVAQFLRHPARQPQLRQRRRRRLSGARPASVHDCSRCCARHSSSRSTPSFVMMATGGLLVTAERRIDRDGIVGIPVPRPLRRRRR